MSIKPKSTWLKEGSYERLSPEKKLPGGFNLNQLINSNKTVINGVYLDDFNAIRNGLDIGDFYTVGSSLLSIPEGVVKKIISTPLEEVTSISNIFKYPHASCQVNNKFYIGTRSEGKIVVFNDPSDLTDNVIVDMQAEGYGAFESMCYDSINNLIYTTCTRDDDNDPYPLRILSINPDDITNWQEVYNSGNDLIAGDSPAIVTDGIYVYGVTAQVGPGFGQDPPKIFKIQISDWTLDSTKTWTNGSYGHAGKLFEYSNKTELYFTDAYGGHFIKVDASDLTYEEIDISAYALYPTDDFYYRNINDSGGICYIASESVGGAVAINTETLALHPFAAYSSFGMFSDGNYLFNMASNGGIQIFSFSNLYLPYNFNINIDNFVPNEFFYGNGKFFLTSFSDISKTLIEFTYIL